MRNLNYSLSIIANDARKDTEIELYKFLISQYAHDVVLTSMQRRFNVMDVVWTSKRSRVLTGILLLKNTL